jgi:midasin
MDESFVGALHPRMPSDLLLRVVLLLNDIHTQINVEHRFGGAGSPWEFNLRDLLRWCHLVEAAR